MFASHAVYAAQSATPQAFILYKSVIVMTVLAKKPDLR